MAAERECHKWAEEAAAALNSEAPDRRALLQQAADGAAASTRSLCHSATACGGAAPSEAAKIDVATGSVACDPLSLV